MIMQMSGGQVQLICDMLNHVAEITRYNKSASASDRGE